MPAVHYETFKARFYECNPFGFLKSITYLRWMAEAAFAASTAVGYDFSKYDRLGQLWLVRENQIDYQRPAKYGDEVEIKTWVMDFRRFRSKRAYQIREKRSGFLIATAETDWVYLETESLRPVQIPNEMKLAFFPEGEPEGFPKRSRFQKPPVPSVKPFSYRKIVGWHDIDSMWHVNNAIYLNYIDEADIITLETCGFPLQRMVQDGITFVSKSQHVEYLQPARYKDKLEITSWHSDIHSKTGIGYYEIHSTKSNYLLVRAYTKWGFVNIKTGEPCDIPRDFHEAITNYKSEPRSASQHK